MKGFSTVVGLVLAALSVAGCFGVEPHGYKELSPITINTASDTINVNLGTELVYNGLDIGPTESRPPAQTWPITSSLQCL